MNVKLLYGDNKQWSIYHDILYYINRLRHGAPRALRAAAEVIK